MVVNDVCRSGSGIAIDDCTFHRCVRLGRFDTDRTISFVPPDGEFQLMSYRITQNVNLPFSILPVITEHGKSRVSYRSAASPSSRLLIIGAQDHAERLLR